MIQRLKFTLTADGPTDQMLMPILTWLFRNRIPKVSVDGDFADTSRFPRTPKSLHEKLALALDYFPCDVLLIHRDAEKDSRARRVSEIETAWKKIADQTGVCKPICVVPIRMSEAWLLFDEPAIRQAAGNPSSKEALDLPPTKRVEAIPDPKQLLYAILRKASGRKGRRLKQFDPGAAAIRLASLIDDFTPLFRLTAFQAVREDLDRISNELGC